MAVKNNQKLKCGIRTSSCLVAVLIKVGKCVLCWGAVLARKWNWCFPELQLCKSVSQIGWKPAQALYLKCIYLVYSLFSILSFKHFNLFFSFQIALAVNFGMVAPAVLCHWGIAVYLWCWYVEIQYDIWVLVLCPSEHDKIITNILCSMSHWN